MPKLQTLEDNNYASQIGGYAIGAAGSVVGVPPEIGMAIGKFLGSFFGGHKNPNPVSQSDIQKQLKVVSVWKKRLNSMGYPISLDQSKAILGRHWGGNFTEILNQYRNFVRRAPSHGVPHPYGSSWGQFVSLFPTYDQNVSGFQKGKYPKIPIGKPYNINPFGKNQVLNASTVPSSVFPILIIIASALIFMGKNNG